MHILMEGSMAAYQRKTVPWFLIVVAFVVFWPLGVVLLSKKLSEDRGATLKSWRFVLYISYLLAGLSLIFGVASIFGLVATAYVAATLFLGSIWVFITAMTTKKRGERFMKYIDIIVNQEQYCLRTIANMVHMSLLGTRDDLHRMIDAGYFEGAYLDFYDERIVLAHHEPPVRATDTVRGGRTAPEGPQIRVVACSGCGANNRVLGYVAICEYCGTYIQ